MSPLQPVFWDAKGKVKGKKVVKCDSGHCTWSSVRPAAESRLGNTDPTADEATSCAIPMGLCCLALDLHHRGHLGVSSL